MSLSPNIAHGRRLARGALVVACGVLGVAGLAACQALGGKQSTRLSLQDAQDLSTQLAAALTRADVLRARDATSPRMVITINRVENLTSDIIPRREQWAMMVRISQAASLVELGKQKNFVLVVPVERVLESGVAGQEGDFAAMRAPTHEIAATLRSATRSGALARTDVYLCDMRMTTIGGEAFAGEVVWTGSFEIKRTALGASFD